MKILKLLLSMKAAIVFLLVLSAVAALGTIVSQGEAPAYYEAHYGARLGRILLAVGIDHIYRTWWFIALGMLLGALILFCTLRRLRWPMHLRTLGSLLLHGAFVAILAGALFSAVTASDETVSLGIGEEATLQQGSLKGAVVGVKDFRVEFYENGMASQYICELFFKAPGKGPVEETVAVNEPYRHGFVTIYQERYGWEVSGTVTIDGRTLPFKLKEGEELELGQGRRMAAMFIPDFDARSGHLQSKSAAPRQPVLAAALEEQERVSDVVFIKTNERARLGPADIHFDRYAPYSGLKVKKDFGIPLVFVAFFFALLGLLLRYSGEWRTFLSPNSETASVERRKGFD